MTKIFYIDIPQSGINSQTKSYALPRKLWYDIKLKKMIEVDGDLVFDYNYSNGQLSVSGKSHRMVNNKTEKSILDNLKNEFDFDILKKSIFSNNMEIIIELFDDFDDFCDSLDYHGFSYHYE
tara:strand:+ start:610 stop:975 length:366 start_codon:yes stop_codon:yes gene_type:complete